MWEVSGAFFGRTHHSEHRAADLTFAEGSREGEVELEEAGRDHRASFGSGGRDGEERWVFFRVFYRKTLK